jgi:hypothetical protein
MTVEGGSMGDGGKREGGIRTDLDRDSPIFICLSLFDFLESRFKLSREQNWISGIGWPILSRKNLIGVLDNKGRGTCQQSSGRGLGG